MAELKKILVLLPDALLAEVNTYVSESGASRSELIREAIREYIIQRKKMDIKERLINGYQLMATINSKWAEDCLEADNQAQFKYEEKLSECE